MWNIIFDSVSNTHNMSNILSEWYFYNSIINQMIY